VLGWAAVLGGAGGKTVAPMAPSKGAATQSMAFAFVWEGEPVLVSDADDAWTVGRPKMRPDSSIAVKTVDEQRLPRDVLQWKHEKLVLFDENLGECETTVIGFAMITVSEWELDNVSVEGKRTPAAIANKVWRGKHQLVARTRELSGSCKDPVLARPARLPKLAIHRFEAAEEKLARRALSRLAAIPDVARWAAEYKKEHPDWSPSPTVTVATLDKASSLIAAAAYGDTCYETGYSAVAIWQATGKGAWRLMRKPKEGDGLIPLLAFDLDGDGILEILFSDAAPNRLGLLRWNGEDYAVREALNIDYRDSDC
jgi:hypothetical protein